ncbi:MAG: hypothetical protein P4M11_15780 [Candidatus Pacebacteria bacterium]|nr:hypothetical protein [Candidatus Paceibacterota bacterium]
MLKHVQRLILIPPPDEEDGDKTWELFADLLSSDVELISVITEGNKNVAYLNNQQVRYFKQLMTQLDESICVYNIDKIFKIFEAPFRSYPMYRISWIKPRTRDSTI